MLRLHRSRIDVVRLMKAPASRVWNLLVDTTRWSEWGPSVSGVECADPRIRLGSSGRVRTALGVRVDFLVTEYEEGRYWAWRVAGFRATGHRLEVLDPALCRLVFEIPLWAMPYACVCLMALGRIVRIVEAPSPTAGA